MAVAGYWVSPRNINRNFHTLIEAKTRDHAKKDELPLIKTSKKRPKIRRGMIRLSASEGRWSGESEWNSHYDLSWKQLDLQDLLLDEYDDDDDDDGDDDAPAARKSYPISITLSVQKHIGFGLSVEGQIVTSFHTTCCSCGTPFVRQLDTTFKAWVLPSRSGRRVGSTDEGIPVIGGDDPSVIYVKPGCEADLDSLVQDTIRLATSVHETCSESCEKSPPKLLYLDTPNAPTLDKRWNKLLELKNAMK